VKLIMWLASIVMLISGAVFVSVAAWVMRQEDRREQD
jgi:hypothetical protein